MKAVYVPNKLFADPSFVEGMGSVLDLAGNLHKDYNTSETEKEADKNALLNDWIAVGEDIRISISEYERESARQA